jgi:tetratricopeptide (TPR) repeat protein
MPENSSLNTRTIIIGAACVVLGFLIGFFLANSINRQEQDKLRSEVASLRAGSATKDGVAGSGNGNSAQAKQATGDDEDSIPTVSDEQLRKAVAQADAAPDDVALQKKVGQLLYMYAVQKSNVVILPEVARILKRAHELDPKDFKTSLLAGDAHFFIARSSDDMKQLAEARKFYESALALKADDVEARTKLGMTYFFDSPSDPQRAIREYRRALQADPRQTFPLQSLIAALIETGSLDEAGKRLDELEKLNYSKQELARLRAQLEQKRNAAKETK